MRNITTALATRPEIGDRARPGNPLNARADARKGYRIIL
jgi:hypothetical protein